MGYNFTESGSYEVNASNLFHYQDEAGEPQPIHATVSTAHPAKVGGGLYSAKRPGSAGLEKGATFTGCSTAQKTIIRAALKVANNYLAVAVTYLTRQTRSTTRYTTWFG
jgi:peptidyl-Lys metalloendopeptidase